MTHVQMELAIGLLPNGTDGLPERMRTYLVQLPR
jgi:hypothetical protein